MNPEIKAKWIEALRSGKYKQGRGRLQRDGGFCCLGVLCDILGAKWEVRGRDGWFANGEPHYPDDEIWSAAGLEGRTGILPALVFFGPYNREHKSVAGLNDAGADFNFIADIIEKQL